MPINDIEKRLKELEDSIARSVLQANSMTDDERSRTISAISDSRTFLKNAQRILGMHEYIQQKTPDLTSQPEPEIQKSTEFFCYNQVLEKQDVISRNAIDRDSNDLVEHAVVAREWISGNEKDGTFDFNKSSFVKDVYRDLLHWMSRCNDSNFLAGHIYEKVKRFIDQGDIRGAYITYCELLVDDFGRIQKNGEIYFHKGTQFRDGLPIESEKDNAVDFQSTEIAAEQFTDQIQQKLPISPDRIILLFHKLTYHEREIIKLKYGIGVSHAHKYEDIGSVFKLPKHRIKEIELIAINKLQKHLLENEVHSPNSNEYDYPEESKIEDIDSFKPIESSHSNNFKYTYEIAIEVLRSQGRPMHYTEVTEAILKRPDGLLGKQGSTPAQTVGAVLRSKPQLFRRLGEGVYTLAR